MIQIIVASISLLTSLASLTHGQDYVRDMKRVFAQPDGKILVLTVVPQACIPTIINSTGTVIRIAEDPKDCFKRIATADCPKSVSGTCLPHNDVHKDKLPSRSKRGKWRAIDPLNPSRGIKIDETIVTKSERIADLESRLDAELAKPTPDSIAAIRFQRQLEKAKATKEDPLAQ